jgi:hypothetical protein
MLLTGKQLILQYTLRNNFWKFPRNNFYYFSYFGGCKNLKRPNCVFVFSIKFHWNPILGEISILFRKQSSRLSFYLTLLVDILKFILNIDLQN